MLKRKIKKEDEKRKKKRPGDVFGMGRKEIIKCRNKRNSDQPIHQTLYSGKDLPILSPIIYLQFLLLRWAGLGLIQKI